MSKYVIAVQKPGGIKRYVGKSIPWVDSVTRAHRYDSEEEANEIVKNPNTAVANRARAGWDVWVALACGCGPGCSGSCAHDAARGL